jgi:hypothetical protein
MYSADSSSENKRPKFQQPNSLPPVTSRKEKFKEPTSDQTQHRAKTPPKFIRPQDVDWGQMFDDTTEAKSSLASSPVSTAPSLSQSSNLQSQTSDIPASSLPISKSELLKSKTPQCPHCQKEVEEAMLKAWERENPVPSLEKRKGFCRLHKLAKAKAEWVKCGYPTIEWGNMEERMEKFIPNMIECLKKPETSYYRTQLVEAVNKGEARTLFQQIARGTEACVGYYGTRGLDVM